MDLGRDDLLRIGIVGGGQMGAGIAEVCARAGRSVVVVESGEEAADAARARLTHGLDRAMRGGRLADEERAAVEDRVRMSTSLEHLADRDLVIEAIAENEASKIEVFAKLHRIVERQDAQILRQTN